MAARADREVATTVLRGRDDGAGEFGARQQPERQQPGHQYVKKPGRAMG